MSNGRVVHTGTVWDFLNLVGDFSYSRLKVDADGEDILVYFTESDAIKGIYTPSLGKGIVYDR